MCGDRELHHFITEPGRFRILRIILQHTEQLPTAYEIRQFCPDLDRDGVRTRLGELLDRGIVAAVTLGPEKRQEGYPHTFYGVTDDGWRFLVNHNLLGSDGVVLRWQDIEVEDPRRLAKHESAPRPDDVGVFQGNPLSEFPAQQLEEYKMVVEQTQDALYLLDAQGRYVLVNEAYEGLTGYRRDELIGSTTQQVLDPEERAKRRTLVTDLLSEDSDRQRHARQSTLRTADGDRIPVEVHLAALNYDGEAVGIVGSARNISDRKRREQELSVLSRVLRHNLGNKVNIIQGYAEVVEDVVDDERALEYTDRIRRTAARLIQQSEKARDIHDLLQEWPPERRPQDVTAIVWDVMSDLEVEFPAAELGAEMPESAWARLPDEFAMAMEELVRNAVEHCDSEHPRVRVCVQADDEDDGDVTVAVEDDGPGIPDHEIAVLSADEETPLEHSEGIGLWMVTWIVDAAEGDVSFEQRAEGGTRVVLEFPKAEPPALTLRM